MSIPLTNPFSTPNGDARLLEPLVVSPKEKETMILQYQELTRLQFWEEQSRFLPGNLMIFFIFEKQVGWAAAGCCPR
jgi:hypothetical protein